MTYCKQGQVELAQADEKKAAEPGLPITSPCVVKTLSGIESARGNLAARKYPEAAADADRIFAESGLSEKTKATQVLEVAQKLAGAKLGASARPLLEKILALKDINEQERTSSIFLLGKLYFEEKNYAKAHGYYNQIPGSFEARVNNIKAYYQENNSKEAAALTASTLEILGQKFYAAVLASEKQHWFNLTNQFLRDAWGLANSYASKNETMTDALVIYQAIKKIVPANLPDGKTVAARIQEIEAKKQK